MDETSADSEEARYQDEQNPRYRDNPLIRALPAIPSESQLFKKFAKLPGPRGDAHRAGSLQYRIDAMSDIQEVYVPFSRDFNCFYQIYNAVRACYAARNPSNPAVMRAVMQGLNGHFTPLVRQSTSGGGANGLVLYGSTGVGKTSMIDRLIDFMGPAVVYHNEMNRRPCRWPQIKYIRVQASPTEGSLAWLAQSVAERIDELFGTRFTARFGSRVGLARYILHMSNAASSHLLGMLIVDDAQNISEVSKSRHAFVKTLATFMEETGIPVLLVSTYKAIPVITEDLMYASKLMARGSTEFPAFELGEEWTSFLEVLWECNPFPIKVEMPADFPRMVHWHSQGILRIARELIVALFSYMARQQVYVPTMDLLDKISEDQLRHYQASLSTLRHWRQGLKFTREEYRVYSDLLPVATGLPQLRDDIKDRPKESKLSPDSPSLPGPLSPLTPLPSSNTAPAPVTTAPATPAAAPSPVTAEKAPSPVGAKGKKTPVRRNYTRQEQETVTNILAASDPYAAIQEAGWLLQDFALLQ